MPGKDYIVKLLPYQVGLFTNEYMKSKINCIPLESLNEIGYFLKYEDSEKQIYDKLLDDTNLKVQVILEKPDSVCMPSLSEKCEDGIEHNDDTKNESLHSQFERANSLAMEILYILHYPGLEPERQYTSDEFRKIVGETGKNIFNLLFSTKYLNKGIFPQTLVNNYRWEKKHKIDEKFPMAAQFYDSKIYSDIISRRLNEQLFADNHVTDDDILDIIEKHPGFFTDEPMDAYREVMAMLDA